MREAAEYFAVAVTNHDHAQHDPQNQKGQRLETIEIAQRVSSGKS
jgi:hypothetical protein